MIIAILSAWSFGAWAEDDFVELRHFSETHCMLLQTASRNPAPTMAKRIEELEQTPDEFHLESQYEHAPDFGFVLPNYWPVMSWAQRVRFNHGLTALIKRRLDIPQRALKTGDCEPQIRIVEHPNQETDETNDEALPRPARLQAIVLMTIRDKQGNNIPLTYLYEKRWNSGWQLEDVVLHTSSVAERDSAKLEAMIRTQGLNELEAYLDQLLNKK